MIVGALFIESNHRPGFGGSVLLLVSVKLCTLMNGYVLWQGFRLKWYLPNHCPPPVVGCGFVSALGWKAQHNYVNIYTSDIKG